MNNYILSTKYDNLVKQAYLIVEKAIDEQIDEVKSLGELGVDVDQSMNKINSYYSLIYYMTYVRQQLDIYIESSGGCISDEDLEKAKSVYKTDCIIEKGVCDRYTNNIVELFMDLPQCSQTPTYTWSTNDLCIVIDSVFYAIGTTLFKKSGSSILEQYYIAPNATVEDIEEITGVTTAEAQSIYNDRLSYPNSQFCCTDPDYEFTDINFDNATDTSLTVSWVSNTTDFVVKLAKDTESNIIFTDQISNQFNYTFTDLEPATSYFIIIETGGCNDRVSITIPVATTPYNVNISVCEVINGQLTLLGAVEGDNTVNFGEDFVFRFDDLAPPIYEVDSVLINGNEQIQNVIFDQITEDINSGGIITLPFNTSDQTVVICGVVGNTCTTIQGTYNQVTSTATLSFY